MKVMRIAYTKKDKNWIVSFTDNNECSVYKSLASDLTAKKLNGCSYIKSIKRVQRYTHCEITVTYDTNNKNVYFLPAHF